jgi:3-oxoacyl-[acyl-carrier-protein] synthase II
MRRVVVTGMAGITALGNDWHAIRRAFESGRSAVRYMPQWECYRDLDTRLAAPLPDFAPPAHWTRKQLRSMGRVAQLAVAAAEDALADAGLLDDPCIRDGRMGVACGSSTGSTPDVQAFVALLNGAREPHGSSGSIGGNAYLRLMSHTTAVNIGIFFGLKGRLIPTSSACTSGSQGIGYACEAIRYGRADLMLAGGAEELCPSEAMVFDALFATSQRNGTPELTPRPYDAARDGLVIGEGAGMLVLEELEHARARGARIHAELVGFACTTDGTHITRPEAATMRVAMEMALRDAGIPAAAIAYVNGHGTATEQGDIAETQATQAVFGARVGISSQKSYLGHTLGACGALESWFSIEMLKAGWYAPTLNLTRVDPRCGALDYIMGQGRSLAGEYVMNNNFAFGGINTSIVFRRWS